MSSFKNILFPINGSQQALDYAIMMAKKSNAKLHLLKTFRFNEINEKSAGIDLKSMKDSLQNKIIEEFEKNYKQKLENATVNYEFKVEIGFLTDRIMSSISTDNIDILLIDGFKKIKDDSLIERITEVKIPVMLIPHYPNVAA